MSKNEKVLKLVPEWASSIGQTTAMRRLIDRGLGLSTADKMVHGRYGSTPKDVVAEILIDEMAKDGFKIAA